MISKNVRNVKHVQTSINEFNFDKLCFRRNDGMQGKCLLKRQFHYHLKRKSS